MKFDFTKIARRLLYLFVFLYPLFYIPKMDFFMLENKLLVLGGFSFFIFLFYVLGVIQKGKIRVSEKLISGSVFIFYFILLLSCLTTGTFGYNLGLSDSFFAFIFYLVLFISGRCLMGKQNDYKNIIFSFIAGVSVSSILFLFNLPGSFISVENPDILAIFCSLCIVSWMYFMGDMKRGGVSVVAIVAILIYLATMLVINSEIAWFALIIGSFIMFWKFWNSKKKNILPFVVAIIAVIFFFGNFNFSFQKNYEVSGISIADSYFVFDFGNNTFADSLFGYGAGSFDQNYLMHNSSPGQMHNQAGSAFLQIFSDFGILGGLALIFVFFAFLAFGIKKFFQDKEENYETLFFASSLTLFLILFFYPINCSLMIFLFLFMGIFSSMTKSEIVEFKRLSSGEIALIIGFLCISLFFLISVFYGFLQTYISGYNYVLGTQAYNAGEEDEAIANFEKSNNAKANISVSQIYLIKASEAYDKIFLIETEEDEKQEYLDSAKSLAQSAEEKALSAIEKEPLNYYSFLNLGDIYWNMGDLFSDDDLKMKASDNYEKALLMAPNENGIYERLIDVYSYMGDAERADYYRGFLNK